MPRRLKRLQLFCSHDDKYLYISNEITAVFRLNSFFQDAVAMFSGFTHP